MEAKDYRIGNTVKSVLTKKPVQIDLWALRVIEEGNYQNSYDTKTKVFRPIPLTEQVLVDCGAKKIDDGLFEIGYLKFKIHSHKYGIDFHFGTDGRHYIKPRFLHSFQNLIFALTGQELEYKPKK